MLSLTRLKVYESCMQCVPLKLHFDGEVEMCVYLMNPVKLLNVAVACMKCASNLPPNVPPCLYGSPVIHINLNVAFKFIWMVDRAQDTLASMLRQFLQCQAVCDILIC